LARAAHAGGSGSQAQSSAVVSVDDACVAKAPTAQGRAARFSTDGSKNA